jgi:LuxR family transcriptional regulator, maltose regulon positive regulatory protein
LLTLVCAPAGAGKTALLSSWLQARPRDDVAWLSMRRERSEAAFWAEFLEAMRRVVPRSSLLGRLAPPRVATRSGFVVQLLNGFAQLEDPVTVVIDDFHEVRRRNVAAALDELLRSAPDTLRLVIATRHDPALPLHLLRASGELTELRARDLSFTSAEAGELFTALGVQLEPVELDAVLVRTEGWAAGLRLFTFSQRDRGGDSTGVAELVLDDRPAAEYLTAEALSRQPVDIRDFLLTTSIVDQVTPELADVLTDRTDSAHVLERLVSENVFIERVEPQTGSYRYHPLFAALLRAELQHLRRAEVPELHRRAASWYYDNGASIDAVQHALEGGDLRLLTASMVDSWFELLGRTDVALHEDFLRQLPPRKLASSQELAAVAATIELVGGNVRRGSRLLARALESAKPPAEASAQAVVTFAHMLQARLEGNASDSVTGAEELVEVAASEPMRAQYADVLRAIALAHLGVAEDSLGRYAEAQAHLEEALELSRFADVPYAELASTGGLASVELAQGRLRRAARLGRSAIELAETRGWNETFLATRAYATTALVELEWDDLEAAAEHSRKLAQVARVTDDRLARAWSAVIDASLCLAAGTETVELGVQHLRGARASLGGIELPRLHLLAARLEARLLSAAGDWETGQAVIERALKKDPGSVALLVSKARLLLVVGDADGALATVAGPVEADTTIMCERAVVSALAHNVTGDRREALSAIEEALGLAEPENMRRPFLEAGSAVIRELLAEHLRRSPSHRWFATEILRRLDGTRGNGAVPADLLEPLSGREQEVLHYLPTMMSNADIAGELFVSVNTVKTHVKSIYRKLDATRRQDAVGRARQLHLL